MPAKKTPTTRTRKPELSSEQIDAMLDAYEHSKAAFVAQNNAKNIAVLNAKVDAMCEMLKQHMSDEHLDGTALKARVQLLEAQINKYKGAMGLLMVVVSFVAAAITTAVTYFKN